jgi:pSer/pThr/pTyr-binding forkhead associated (FHA) protein
MARLIIEEEGKKRTVDLPPQGIEIGRGHENGVVISDPRSSRRHCRVLRTPQGWVLEDLKSRNGTLMGGSPVEKSFLVTGDQFAIGKTHFRFEDAPQVAPAPESEAPAAPSRDAVDLEEFRDGTDRDVEEGSDSGTPEAPEAVSVGSADSAASPGETGGEEPIVGFYLEGTEGPYFGQKIEISRIPFTIGRKKSCDFAIADPRASAVHARISRIGGRLSIADLDSRNGIQVNHRKVREAALTQGALIRIGDSLFRAEVPPGERTAETPAEAAQAAGDSGAGVVAVDDFARFNAREFLKGGDRTSPLSVAAVLLVLGTLLYFALDVTMKSVRRIDIDPSPKGNSIANWSFEDRKEGPGIPGWALAEGSEGQIEITRDGAQYPGERALRLSMGTASLARAASAVDVPVDPRASYRLTAHVTNLGTFAAGVAISWLIEADGRRVEVGRDWGTAVREDSKAEEIDRVVFPPPAAVFARISPYAISSGAGGAAAFDRVAFGPAEESPSPGDSTAEEAGGAEDMEDASVLPAEIMSGEPGGGAASARSGAPIRAVVGEDGVLRDVGRGEGPVIASAWVGLGGDADPLAVGARLLIGPRPSSEREGIVLAAQVPDISKGDWFPLEARVNGGAGEIVCEYKFSGARKSGGKEGYAAEKAAFFLEPAPGVREAAAFGGSLQAPAAVAPDRLESPLGPLDELVFGSGAEQVAVFFRPAVTLRAIEHPESYGRKLLVAEASLAGETGARPGSVRDPGSVRTLSVRISPFSRREEEAAAGILAEAGRLHREGKPAEARGRLDELRKRYPWRAADLLKCAEMEKAWNLEAEGTLESIRSGIEDLRATPAPVIRDALLARIEILKGRLNGTPSEGKLDALARDILKVLPLKGEERQAPVPLLQEARAYLDRGQPGLADLCLQIARQGKLTDAEEAEAGHLAGLIAERRKQRSIEEVR